MIVTIFQDSGGKYLENIFIEEFVDLFDPTPSYGIAGLWTTDDPIKAKEYINPEEVTFTLDLLNRFIHRWHTVNIEKRMADINLLIKNALKSGNKTELKAYRNLKAEFQQVQTSKEYKGEWTEDLEIKTISKYARKLDAAIAEFGGPQTTLGSEYRDELEVLKKLLPEPVNASQIMYELIQWAKNNLENFSSEPEYDAEIGAVIPRMNIQIPKKEMGTVIKYLKSKFPTADGKMISEIVKKYVV